MNNKYRVLEIPMISTVFYKIFYSDKILNEMSL